MLSTRSTSLFLLGGLFGSDEDKNDSDELASFANFPSNQYDGLTEYIRQWAKILETEGSLTTPIQVTAEDQGVKILFKPKESTYKSKDEERAAEEGTAEKKKEPQKEGGVQVMVEQDGDEVKVVATRCEMDEDTMIREMSEEAIISGLKKAINVWKKDHPK